VSELKEQRQKARNLKAPIPAHDAGGKPTSELHSEYLTVNAALKKK
jgi:maltose-binding protein MalE